MNVKSICAVTHMLLVFFQSHVGHSQGYVIFFCMFLAIPLPTFVIFYFAVLPNNKTSCLPNNHLNILTHFSIKELIIHGTRDSLLGTKESKPPSTVHD